MKKEFGIQLYSVRDISAKSLEDALKGVSDLGYKYVEFAGFFGHTAEQVNEMLKKYDLTVVGAHSGVQDLCPEKIEETVRFHKAIQNPMYIIPWADFSSQEKLDDFITLVNQAQPILADAGIQLAYHNHSFEYEMMPCGSTAFSQLEKKTNLDFELDTYWIYNAGLDPVEEMKRLRERVKLIHIKDGFTGGEGVPLGRGTAPVEAVYRTALDLGDIIIVESETLTPDGMTEAKECIEYLRKLDA